MQILFLLEAFEQKFTVSGEDIPVDVSQIIPPRVLAMVGELDASAELFRATLRQQFSSEYASRNQRQVLEPFHKVRIEKRHMRFRVPVNERIEVPSQAIVTLEQVVPHESSIERLPRPHRP